jgi:hypothetical protein
MQRSLSRFAAGSAIALASFLAGCGASASRPDPTPVSAVATSQKPAPPRLPAHHASDAIFVLDLTDRAAVQPTTVFFASDGTLEHMQWRHWGDAVTDGRGTAAVRVCTPDCVDGHTVFYPVTVTLSHRTSCFGARFYGDSSIVAETRRGPAHFISYIRDPC